MENIQNTYARLPNDFHRSTKPTPVSRPKTLSINYELANELSIDTTDEAKLLEYFSGNTVHKDATAIARLMPAINLETLYLSWAMEEQF